MIVDTSQYVLKNLHTGKHDDAVLYHTITDHHINHVEDHWNPLLHKHLDILKKKYGFGSTDFDHIAFFKELGELNIQDAKWDWKEKRNILSNTFGYCGCALICNGLTQGLGYFEILQKHKSQISTDIVLSIIYVEFIATAPWNRDKIERQLYAGVGLTMIYHAINISFGEGLDGRVGLHSLPQSNDFYSIKCGMTDFGPDKSKDNMNYFEMSNEQAIIFLLKVNESIPI
ncbi:hypothetical protein MNBD_GAMMA12-347 [hydrothermal vent metagenome]|uniref:Uncharacterized protein n=1 Tax=hydrothermal vent metagenome TaxID=652676 RepID=A0A3B0YDP7_9ZZZZ